MRRLFENNAVPGGDAGALRAVTLEDDLTARRRRRQSSAAGGLSAGDPGLALLERARQGDPEAIAQLYRKLQPRLLAILRFDVGDAADDVASQAWLEVFGALGRFKGDLTGFRSLLFTIARRRVADHRRTQRRRPSTATDPEALRDRVEAGDDTEGSALEGITSRWAVRRIIELLPHDQAEVVLLRVVADLPVDEVAALLGRPAGTIRVQQHRALKRLAAALAGNDETTLGDLAGDD